MHREIWYKENIKSNNGPLQLFIGKIKHPESIGKNPLT